MESIIQNVIGKKDTSIRPDIKGVTIKTDVDEELRQIVEGIKTSIKIVGTGGAGNNTLNRLANLGIHSGEIVAVNTDAQDLLYTNADAKVLIGLKTTRGIGAGNDPDVGERCAKEDVDKIANALHGGDMVFITCGLGGGTGTGSAHVIAEVAQDVDALTIGIVTIPFSVEGRVRAANALKGLKKLQQHADTVIVIPNDRLMDIVPKMALNDAFRVADEVLANAVKGISEMVTKEGLVNLDFADLNTILRKGGTALIGLGESTASINADNRALESVEKALKSPLLDTDISSANAALVNIIGGRDMTLEEAETIVKRVSESIDPNAQIIWGAQVDEGLDNNKIRTLLVIAGVKSPSFEAELRERAAEKGTGADVLDDLDIAWAK
ncbi:MAG: cell division protein FtsZ [Candidatus Altiarchaeales archaeon HGW-Altiarchaeales-3]|nr:MAG: cell division protein FtsZ [Candidatus Altiarchaeales archaeon HGW-Altiarchaeales-3]